MSGSQCCTHLRNEFQLKHFGFTDAHFARFAYSQWRWPIGVVLVYRFVVSAYTLSWQMYTIVELGGDVDTGSALIPAWAFLTNWTYFVLTLYLFLHFLVSLWFVMYRGRHLCSVPVRENHRRLFHELQVQPSLWRSNQYEVVHGTGSDVEDEGHELVMHSGIPRFHKIVWMLFNVASAGCLMVTLIFWTMLYPQLHLDSLGLYINFQLHAVTSIIILIEHLVTAIPVRLLHLVYTLVYGLIYLVFNFIFYEVRKDHPVVYPGVLDFSRPGTTAVVLSLTVLVLLPVTQLFLYAIYKLKLFVYSRCINPDTE